MNTVDDEIDWDAPDVREALADAAGWQGGDFSVIPHDGISFGGKAEKLKS